MMGPKNGDGQYLLLALNVDPSQQQHHHAPLAPGLEPHADVPVANNVASRGTAQEGRARSLDPGDMEQRVNSTELLPRAQISADQKKGETRGVLRLRGQPLEGIHYLVAPIHYYFGCTPGTITSDTYIHAAIISMSIHPRSVYCTSVLCSGALLLYGCLGCFATQDEEMAAMHCRSHGR